MMEPFVPAALAPRPETFRESLSIKLIRRELCTETVGFQMYLFSDVPSTNQVLRLLADTGARQGAVLLAESQHAGGGRPGRPWFSPPGVNLYLSVLFRPSIPRRSLRVFSFITLLAVTDAIWAEGLTAGVRWPNDVLVEGRKVAASWVDAVLDGDLVESAVLGVAANLNVAQSVLREALGPDADLATSLAEVAGRAIARNSFAARFLNRLEKWFNLYMGRGPQTIVAAWHDRDLLAGHEVEVRTEGIRYEGCARGVDGEGRLEIEGERGAHHRVDSGEILVRD